MDLRKKYLRFIRKGCRRSVRQHCPSPPATDSCSSAASSSDDPNFASRYEDAATSARGCFGEEQLEEILLRQIDATYKEAISKIAAVYGEDIALQAVLRNGHCYGTMDVLTNIVDNAMSCINSSFSAADSDDSHDGPLSSASLAAAVVAVAMDPSNFAFSDIRHLEEYSLAGMICLLQEIRPELSRMDAMWCLLMSDLNVSQARKFPALPSSPRPMMDGPDGGSSRSGDFDCTLPYEACGLLHGGCGDEEGCNCSKRYTAAGVCAKSNLFLPPQIKQEISRMVCTSESDHRDQHQQKQSHQGEDAGVNGCDVVSSVLKGLKNMSVEEMKENDGTEGHKTMMILNVEEQIRKLEIQVKERKQWAEKTSMQAALKLGTDLTELEILTMKGEENHHLREDEQKLKGSTLKRLSEMENALRKASVQVDCVNAVVKQLEKKNAVIRAEMEASSKLSASESATTCMWVRKREKKFLKRLSLWQKQKNKLHMEVAEEKRKISKIQRTLSQLKDAQIKK